jgi:hypothetical protein
MIVFLIDADNFSAPVWIDEAFKAIEATEGAITIRRAYGSPENLKGLSDILRAWAIRPFVNLPLSKNTTDMSLAIDAMELACAVPKPGVVVIGSGDLDFLPLVVRLRERGIKVICATERSKMAQDAIPAYDRVLYVGADLPSLSKAVEVKSAALIPAIAQKVPEVTLPTAKPKSVAKKAAAKKALAKKATAAKPETLTVQKILLVVPNLKAGQWQPLGEVAKLLHDQKLLAKSATSTKLFKKFAGDFELAPAGKPNKVRFVSL